MFIRLKTGEGNEVNVNINNIKSFGPITDGDGSRVDFVDGTAIKVQESCRSIRGYSKKAMFEMHTGGGAQEDEPAPAPAQ